MAAANRKPAHCEIFILAGGLSTRMGRDKSRVRLGSQTLLGHVRKMAAHTGLRVRVIRRDAVPRCGPIGGIYTGLQSSRADYVLFLACDMPFVSTELLGELLKESQSLAIASKGRSTHHGKRNTKLSHAIFATNGHRAGFPILLHREAAFPIISRQIEARELSLQALARKLRAKTMRFPARQLANINTASELARANKDFPRRFVDDRRW